MSADIAARFREFMGEHLVVSILVAPGGCTGLEEFPTDASLRIDLSHSFAPPMWPEANEAGLDFRASFSKVGRHVHVPWASLLWAGVPATASGATPTQSAVAALQSSAAQRAAAPAGGSVINVDFKAKKRL